MTATFTVDDMYDALDALPGAHPDPHSHRDGVALTVAAADPEMVETWVPVSVCWPRLGRPAMVSVSAYVTYTEAETDGWMAAYDLFEFTDYPTAEALAEAVQKSAEELTAQVNGAARLVLAGKPAAAVELVEDGRIKWSPANQSLEEVYEELAEAGEIDAA